MYYSLWYKRIYNLESLIKDLKKIIKLHIDKYEEEPNVCYINIKYIEFPEYINNIKIIKSEYILPNHIMIGVENVS